MLQDEAIRSSQIYLNYLTEHREEGLGLVRARVRSIQGSFLDDRIVLITDRIIKSPEGIIIRINDVTYENTQEKRYFAITSISKRKVTIEPIDDLKEEIESAWINGDPIILESDLTFLVKRVKEWYEAYGDRVALPTTIRKRESRDILADNLIELSENQYECAILAMTAPLVYIWGAPGTGKTKRVLASCISDYIRMEKKIILVAPTNNALEQSLSGLLLALSSECGIDPVGKVIRLGVPSDTFHRVWKGICEDGASDWIREKIILRLIIYSPRPDRKWRSCPSDIIYQMEEHTWRNANAPSAEALRSPTGNVNTAELPLRRQRPNHPDREALPYRKQSAITAVGS